MKKEEVMALVKAKGIPFKGRMYVNLTGDPMEMRGDDGTVFTVEPLGEEIIPERERLDEQVFKGVSKTGVALVTKAVKAQNLDEEAVKTIEAIKAGSTEVYFMGTPFMLKAFPKIVSVPVIHHKKGPKTRVYHANQMWVAG